MKRGNARQLLIGKGTEFRWLVQDRGISWVTDRYVLARLDVFRTAPKVATSSEHQDAARRGVRLVLDTARRGRVVGTPKDSEHRTRNGPVGCEVAMLRLPGFLYLPVNAACWEAWAATGLRPEVRSSGKLLWWGQVRGRDALFGVVMPMMLGKVHQ